MIGSQWLARNGDPCRHSSLLFAKLIIKNYDICVLPVCGDLHTWQSARSTTIYKIHDSLKIPWHFAFTVFTRMIWWISALTDNARLGMLVCLPGPNMCALTKGTSAVVMLARANTVRAGPYQLEPVLCHPRCLIPAVIYYSVRQKWRKKKFSPN